MTLLTPEFKQLFENNPLFSQVWNLNPIVLARLTTSDKAFLVLEYSDNSKTAFWYIDDFGLGYAYIPNLENKLPYQLDIHFLPKHLNELMDINDEIIDWLKDRCA